MAMTLRSPLILTGQEVDFYIDLLIIYFYCPDEYEGLFPWR
jgi:hypothetical protein